MTISQLRSKADFHDLSLVQVEPTEKLQTGDYFRWTKPGPNADFTPIEPSSDLDGMPCGKNEVYRLVPNN